MKYKIAVTLAVSMLAISAARGSEYDRLRKAPQIKVPEWRAFPLSEVTLGDGSFREAMELHKSYILSLEVDRLIPHVLHAAGLEPKGRNYGGWETSGGCTYGHYMSACAMMWASTGDEILLERLDYILAELKRCQAQTADGWFLGGREGFTQLIAGELTLNRPDEARQPWNFNRNGNGWYSVHKVMSGLRDAWLYAGRKEALEVLIPMADFVAGVALATNKDIFQAMLSVEHGGMNELFADIYGITGEAKYLETARRFNHINVIYPTAAGEDVLFGRHANDQIPKFVGAARQWEYSGDEILLKAAENFWKIVTEDHTLAIGGNSCFERFGLPGQESERLDFTSAETCNTYNMLKLTRQLFQIKGDFDYLNYYEHALYNHILASIDPHEPGAVTYYTSLMPGFLKQYSTPYDSFWCCVGTGLENHSKYGESIYFHSDNRLLVNMFIPSRLDWKEKGFVLTMDTRFPESDIVKIKIDDPGDFSGSLMLRYPDWVEGKPSILLNGKPARAEFRRGEYIRLVPPLAAGDEIVVTYPRSLHLRYTRDEPYFGTVMYGPLVLAGRLGTENMPEDHVSDSRTMMELQPVKDIPMLVGSKADLRSWIVPASDRPLHFKVLNGEKERPVELIPYYRMHHEWHTVYWKIYTPEEFRYRRKSLTDEVLIADQDSEKGHALRGVGDTVSWNDFFWARNTQYRVAENGGWFSYELAVDKNETKPYWLVCRWWGDEGPGNKFEIWVDDTLLTEVDLHRGLVLTYLDELYEIPASLTKGKSKITVSFRSSEGHRAGGLYNLKITSDPDFR